MKFGIPCPKLQSKLLQDDLNNNNNDNKFLFFPDISKVLPCFYFSPTSLTSMTFGIDPDHMVSNAAKCHPRFISSSPK